MVNAGLIPMMRTAKDCKFVLEHRWQWRGAKRVQALEMAHDQLALLRTKKEITGSDFTELNGRLIQAIAQEKG